MAYLINSRFHVLRTFINASFQIMFFHLATETFNYFDPIFKFILFLFYLNVKDFLIGFSKNDQKNFGTYPTIFVFFWQKGSRAFDCFILLSFIVFKAFHAIFGKGFIFGLHRAMFVRPNVPHCIANVSKIIDTH